MRTMIFPFIKKFWVAGFTLVAEALEWFLIW